MDGYKDKINICGHEINQRFYIHHKCLQPILSIIQLFNLLEPPMETIEYIIIEIDTNEEFILEETSLVIRMNNIAYMDIQNGLIFNKIYPFQLSDLYDSETNKLLKKMVNCDKNDKLRKVLFYPIRSRHNGFLNFKNIDNLSLWIWLKIKCNINIYLKLNHRYSEIDPIQKKYSNKYQIDKIPMIMESIEHFFMGAPDIGKLNKLVVYRNAHLIDNICLLFESNKLKINWHRIYKFFKIEIGGILIAKIPIDYMILYYKIIKNVDIFHFKDNNHFVFPILLEEIIGIPFLHLYTNLFQFNEIRLCVEPRAIDELNYDLKRNIAINQLTLNQHLIDNFILWKYIISYLTDIDWYHLRQTCHFFYFIDEELTIKKRYQKYEIKQNKHYLVNNSILCNYHYYGSDFRKAAACDQYYNFPLNLENDNYLFSSWIINQLDFNISDSHQLSITENTKFVKWIIIKLDYCLPDIIDTITITYDEHSMINDLEKQYINIEKMHNPKENRWYIIPNKQNINMIEINLKQIITTNICIYIANQVISDYKSDPFITTAIKY